jgi:hypothetical protein
MRILTRWVPIFLCLLGGAILPQLARATTISLDGDWHFVADPTGALDVQKLASVQDARPTRVPSSWQSQFADLRDYAGVAWYWRAVNVPAIEANHEALLRFGAVDYLAEVYVNGQKAGSHEGGYLPFELDATTLLRPGENQIAVRVADPGAKPSVVDGINYAEIPHGKQNWYVQTSGLWQSVELDIRPRFHLGVAHITAGADGKFQIALPLVNLPPAGQPAQPPYAGAEILDPAGKSVWRESHNLSGGEAQAEFSGHLDGAQLWSPASPALYTLHAWLSSGDDVTTHFGFRTFQARDGKFYLNGRAIYLRGALDQAFYPRTVYTPPSLDFLKNEMREAKALGLNLLRCHIKVPDPRYLEAADEAGMLVWYEIPNWDKLTPDSERRALATLRGMVERDWNHPCIILVSIINESWGIDLTKPAERAWLKGAYEEAKKFVPGWLVEDNSACCQNFHMETDIADFHNYNAIPDYAGDFDRLAGDLARRPRWLFSPYGDAAPRGDEPLVLSEFGNWGLPRVPATRPWWFAREFGGRKITLPEGVAQRYRDYQLNALFPTLDALSDATQWHEFTSLKYEIESLRSRPPLQGYVITEFTDINWESNGLLDMWRHPKVFADRLAQLQRDDVIVPRTDQRNYLANEQVHVNVYVSHYSSQDLSGATIDWNVEGTPLQGTLPVPRFPAPQVVEFGPIEFPAPATSAPAKRALNVELLAGGKTLAENSLELYFYPPETPELPPPVSFEDPAGRLRRLPGEMNRRNYMPPTGGEAFPVLIASTFDDKVKATLEAGGRVLLLTGHKETLAPGIEIVPRATNDYSGNWISNFLWLRKDQQPFKSIGFDTLPGFETQAVTPLAVIKGIPAQNFNDVLAGMFYGWIHDNVGVLVQARYGKGRLLICTFSLGTTYGSDPYATYLLDALVNYAVAGPPPSFEIPAQSK